MKQLLFVRRLFNHNSVLVAFGETCTFVGALFGVDYSYKIKSVQNEREDK